MSFEKAKSNGSTYSDQVIADVVLAGDVSLDEDHKNAGGAPVEDQSPIGQDVGWWTAVFLSTSISNCSIAQTNLSGANRLLTDDWNGYVPL